MAALALRPAVGAQKCIAKDLCEFAQIPNSWLPARELLRVGRYELPELAPPARAVARVLRRSHAR